MHAQQAIEGRTFFTSAVSNMSRAQAENRRTPTRRLADAEHSSASPSACQSVLFSPGQPPNLRARAAAMHMLRRRYCVARHFILFLITSASATSFSLGHYKTMPARFYQLYFFTPVQSRHAAAGRKMLAADASGIACPHSMSNLFTPRRVISR